VTVCATLSKGSPAPRVFIVGDSPSKDDAYYKSPFSGFAGRLYEGLLRTAGVPLADTYWRTLFPTPLVWGEGEDLLVKRKRSPGPDQLAAQNLRDDLEKRRPTLIVALGNFSMWALTGQYGVMIWRGSQFTYTYSDGTKANLVATYEPSSVMADMALRPQVLRDFQRAAAGQIRVLEVPAYRVRVALGMPENLANYTP
jgi:uracil-DNA glycosylase family 4